MVTALAANAIGADNESGCSVAVKRATLAKTPEAYDVRQAAHLLFGSPVRKCGASFLSRVGGWYRQVVWLAVGDRRRLWQAPQP